MDVFYNPKGIGDVLIIPFEDGDRYEIKHEAFGDVTKITDQEGNILGYNIFKASSYFTFTNTGKIMLTPEMYEKIKDVFKQNHLKDSLDWDLSPTFVVGFVKEKSPHEDADKLNVCQVDIGDKNLQIVCGAPNVDIGQRVVVAKVGAVMPSGLKIRPTKLRGVPSNGMICSQNELGLPDAPAEKGIYVLDDTYTIGQAFSI
ncbi:YtpR family tRNA-binding protein [Virgibacillus flavescens]|uniref:YtpR family tRNA-binding protein n=1 Tax=Virgibacillus flavescens TaxID=1611422 RepID=UPI003D3399A6